ncbi:MAG TPA: aldo/keto reductase [Gemmatimonadales bacterium]|nr:aldo/keto reductase [Gemmatimonadales bacterium]
MERRDDGREVSRREFLRLAGAAALAVRVGPNGVRYGTQASAGDMPYRTLGQTGERVSIVGLGGYHIGVPPESDGLRLIRSAIDRGINFLDNCWDYHQGDSEVRMGKALRDGYRDRVFLMTKIDGQTRQAAARQLDESLKRLQTDRIDLVQCHEVIRPGDPDRIFGAGGAIEALLAAKQAGKLRYIGFTGHKSPAIHLKMLETAQAHGFRFDAVQMPLNVMDAHFDSFERRVLPVLVQRRIGVLGMKPLASGILLESGTVTALEALHYAMSLPTSVVITGCESMERLSQAVQAALTFRPLGEAQVAQLLAKTASAARDGRFEPYKTTQGFDGTVHHPELLG